MSNPNGKHLFKMKYNHLLFWYVASILLSQAPLPRYRKSPLRPRPITPSCIIRQINQELAQAITIWNQWNPLSAPRAAINPNTINISTMFQIHFFALVNVLLRNLIATTSPRPPTRATIIETASVHTKYNIVSITNWFKDTLVNELGYVRRQV